MAGKKRRTLRLKKGDVVRVISGGGALSGQQGRILRANAEGEKVIVEGVNYVYKHIKRSQEQPKGGRIQKEAPVHVSNVMLVCPECRQTTRVRMETDAVSGKRRRMCKKCDKPV